MIQKFLLVLNYCIHSDLQSERTIIKIDCMTITLISENKKKKVRIKNCIIMVEALLQDGCFKLKEKGEINLQKKLKKVSHI